MNRTAEGLYVEIYAKLEYFNPLGSVKDRIGAGFVPSVLDRSIIDDVVTVQNKDVFETARRLAKSEGFLCGISSGASVWAAMEVAKRTESRGKMIVTIVPSTGERYLSTELFKISAEC